LYELYLPLTFASANSTPEGISPAQHLGKYISQKTRVQNYKISL